MNLKIKIDLNKELDKEMALYFLDISTGGIDFSGGIINPHPDLGDVKEKSKKERIKVISKYFDKYYKTNKNLLENIKKDFQKDWDLVENDFIEQLNILFKNPELSKGKYIGYVSIINCNPRFLDDKTFQVFYKHKNGSNLVIAHEVLHFFFFDYAIKKYPELFGELDMGEGIFWGLSELFNDVILSLPEFVDIHGNNSFVIYPKHKPYLDDLKKIWFDNSDIDSWLVEAFEYLKKKNY